MTHSPKLGDDLPDGTAFAILVDDDATQVVRTRHLPRDWDRVHESHEVKARVEISEPQSEQTWGTEFELIALGNTGCLVSAKLGRRLRPFPLQNECRVTIPIPDESPVTLDARIDDADIRGKGASTLKILFSDLTADDERKLSLYRAFLRKPASVEDETVDSAPPRVRPLMDSIRRRLPIALGLALLSLSSDTPPNIPTTTTTTAPRIEEVQAHCRIRFADGVYFPKCGDTLEEKKSTKLKFLPKAEQPQQGKGLTLKADVMFERDGKLCKTAASTELMQGETVEGSVRFTCAEPPR